MRCENQITCWFIVVCVCALQRSLFTAAATRSLTSRVIVFLFLFSHPPPSAEFEITGNQNSQQLLQQRKPRRLVKKPMNGSARAEAHSQSERGCTRTGRWVGDTDSVKQCTCSCIKSTTCNFHCWSLGWLVGWHTFRLSPRQQIHLLLFNHQSL
jgi:hypothetical protein